MVCELICVKIVFVLDYYLGSGRMRGFKFVEFWKFFCILVLVDGADWTLPFFYTELVGVGAH